MKLKIDVLEESIRQIVREESEYQEFFKKALEKAGKSIPQMSDEEKKAFFNKIDAAWKAKGEKNESVNEIQYKDAVEKFNADLMKNSQVERIAKFHKKSIKDVVKALQPYIKVLRYNDKSVKVISIDFRDTNSEVKVHVSQTYKQNESVNESATKAIDMLLKNKGVKDAIRNDKVKVIRKALEDEGFNTKGISDKDILTLAKNLQNESVNESLKKFDDVHIKSKNLSGMVVGIRGNTLVVQTIDGLVKAKKNDVTKIQSDNINEDFGTIALGVAGGLLLLKVLKFVAKKIIGGVARNAPLGKEPLYTTIDSMTKELIKVKTKDPNGKLKEVSLMDIVKLQVVLKELVDKGQIKTMKDIQNIIAKASKR